MCTCITATRDNAEHTVLCRSLDSHVYIRISYLTNDKWEWSQHHYNDISYFTLIGQSDIWMFLGLLSDIISALCMALDIPTPKWWVSGGFVKFTHKHLTVTTEDS